MDIPVAHDDNVIVKCRSYRWFLGIAIIGSTMALAQAPTPSDPMHELRDKMNQARNRPDRVSVLSQREISRMTELAAADELQNGSNSYATASNLLNGQTLLATRSNDQHCLHVYLFKRSGLARRDFELSSTLNSTPSGSTFCAPDSCRYPDAVVRWADTPQTPDAPLFTVFIPRQAAPDDHDCLDNLQVEYRFRKGEYSATEEVHPAVADYFDCDYVLRGDVNAATDLAVIEVLPALAIRRYGVAIRQRNGEIVAEKFEVLRSASEDISGPKTPSECKPQTFGSPVRVKISSSKLAELMETLKAIDLKTDRCPREKSGECARFLDGTRILVLLPHEAPIALTALGHPDKIRSENPALYTWVYQLIRETQLVPTGKGSF